ncbi:MAG: YibE/F family protein [Oscillospiraceae bacterium]|jgi:uncharacterized membrane protein|nr:YibE/F family protein [Oscillospiraceae bacterium]
MAIQKTDTKRAWLAWGATIAVALILLWIGHAATRPAGGVFGGGEGVITRRAQVLRILESQFEAFEYAGEDNSANLGTTTIVFEAKILQGKARGETVSATQTVDGSSAFQQRAIQLGDKILLSAEEPDLEAFFFEDYSRSGPLYLLLLFFCALIILFGRKTGVNTVLSLAFTVAAVFLVLLPAVLGGQNIYLWSVLTCVYVTAVTMPLISGYGKKTLAATVGCIGGVLAAGLFMLLMTHALKLSGLVDEDSLYLGMLKPEDPIDLRAVLFAMVIVGAVGAVMDVAMSIASALYELKEKAPTLTRRELFNSGLRIGRDMMGTMANTLVLAYIGSSMTCVLLQMTYSANAAHMLGKETVISELLQGLVGSIGMVLALPLTSAVSAVLFAESAPTADKEKI